jgi:hypothetical protein
MVVAPGRMIDSFLSIPDAESLPLYRMVLKLACVCAVDIYWKIFHTHVTRTHTYQHLSSTNTNHGIMCTLYMLDVCFMQAGMRLIIVDFRFLQDLHGFTSRGWGGGSRPPIMRICNPNRVSPVQVRPGQSLRIRPLVSQLQAVNLGRSVCLGTSRLSSAQPN